MTASSARVMQHNIDPPIAIRLCRRITETMRSFALIKAVMVVPIRVAAAETMVRVRKGQPYPFFYGWAAKTAVLQETRRGAHRLR